jgi:cyclohexanone monooxygenase
MSQGGELGPDVIVRAFEDSDDEKMAEIRARVDATVNDSDTAEALKPWYRQLCKRPCFHDEYLDAFNEPGTRLVDTDGRGVEAITPTGVVVGGEHFELDCIIYASGFEVGTDYARRSGFDAVGRDGVKLSERWADGMRSMHGIHVRGFPNMFVVGPNQGANLISNIPHNLTEAGETIATVVVHAIEVGADEVEVTEEAEDAWIDLLQSSGGGPAMLLGNPDCTPGYYNNEGQPIAEAALLNMAGYPQGPVAYFQYIDRWRRSGDFEGLEFRSRAS